MIEKFKAVTKADIAEALSCSVRNIEKLISAGKLPQPKHIGGLPRWHPEVIYTWLDMVLRDTSEVDSMSAERDPENVRPRSPMSARLAPQKSGSSNAVKRMQARQATKLGIA